jgi:hypothetical protein
VDPIGRYVGPMTLAVAWERTTGSGSELLFAADSRVRQGGEWDTCPKVFRLPRSDALIAFAGDTWWAYPIVFQTIATIDAFEPSRTRHYNLRATRGHVMRAMDAMMQSGSAPTGDLHDPKFEFLFGGWSWQEQAFLLWRLYWAPHFSEMRHDPVDAGHLGKVRFIGDRDRDRDDPELEVVGDAKRRLSEILREKYGQLTAGTPLDMEPWAVLVEMLESGAYRTLGGPPQLAKVYRSMNSTLFAIRWPTNGGGLTLGGRRLLGYETTDAPVLGAE